MHNSGIISLFLVWSWERIWNVVCSTLQKRSWLPQEILISSPLL